MVLKNKLQKHWLGALWGILTMIFAGYYGLNVRYAVPVSIIFKPQEVKSAQLELETNSVHTLAPATANELVSGKINLLGSYLKTIVLIPQDGKTPELELVFRLNGVNQKESLSVSKTNKGLIYQPQKDLPSIYAYANKSMFSVVCLTAGAFMAFLICFIIFLSTHFKTQKKFIFVFGITFTWLTFHLLAYWPGWLSWDILVNYSNSLKFTAYPWIQALTSIYQTALIVIYPSMSMNSFLIIFLISVTLGLMAQMFIQEKKSCWFFTILALLLLINPLNIYMSIFQNRDVEFSWLFFLSSLLPTIIIISDRKSPLLHAIFIGTILLSILVRKDALLVLPFALYWSWHKIDLCFKEKLLSVCTSLLFLIFCFYGTTNLRLLNDHPLYLSTIYIGPMADITNKVGWGDFEENEKNELKQIMNINSFRTNFNPEDIFPYPFLALNNGFNDESLGILKKAYFRLLWKHPVIWAENRMRNFVGTLKFNNLLSGYPYDLKESKAGPDIQESVLRSLSFSKPFVNKDNWYFKTLENLWSLKDGMGLCKLLFYSFFLPLIFSMASFPWLKRAEGARFAFVMTCLRLLFIIPIMPAPYFKYVYASYLTLLFIPLLVFVELQKTNLEKSNE